MTSEGVGRPLEVRVGRLLRWGTYASVALIAAGVILMAATGRSPLDAAPALDLGGLLGDVTGLRPAGFLWLGLLLVLVTPSARVAASLMGFARGGEPVMAAVSALILAVVALGVVAGTIGG